MIYTAVDNFYLTDAEIENSPSRGDGIDAESETTMRTYGAELIQEGGVLLGCPQAVMATAQILLQRFYCKKSLKDFNVRRMAPACLFVAAKLEEWQTRPRLMRDVIMVFDRVLKRRESRPLTLIDNLSKDYIDFKNSIIRFELNLLKTFGFIVHAQHPHTFVVNYVRMLTEGDDSSPLFQESWNICNDSLRITLCVRFKPEVVACGAIFLAARRLMIPLPEAPAWWGLFTVSTEQLVEVVRTLHELYSRPKALYVHVSRDAAPPAKPATPVTPLPLDASPAGAQQSGAADVAGSTGGRDAALTTPAEVPSAPPLGGAVDTDHAAGLDGEVSSGTVQEPGFANGEGPSTSQPPDMRSHSREHRRAGGEDTRGEHDGPQNGGHGTGHDLSERHERDRRDTSRGLSRDPKRYESGRREPDRYDRGRSRDDPGLERDGTRDRPRDHGDADRPYDRGERPKRDRDEGRTERDVLRRGGERASMARESLRNGASERARGDPNRGRDKSLSDEAKRHKRDHSHSPAGVSYRR